MVTFHYMLYVYNCVCVTNKPLESLIFLFHFSLKHPSHSPERFPLQAKMY